MSTLVSFHPVIQFPKEYDVYDFSTGRLPDEATRRPYGIGRYNEKRPRMYVTELFGGTRDIHMGVDLFAPVGTAVYAFADGRVHLFGNNSAPGDYGYTVVTEHRVEGRSIWALYGHLGARSIEGKATGQSVCSGEILGWVGDVSENGGWSKTHLHFQLSYERPEKPDMPGVVSDEDWAAALLKFPDPRTVLGPIY